MTIDDFEIGMWVRYDNYTGEVVGIVKGLSGVPDFKCIEVEFTESVCLSNFASSRHTFYDNETFLETVDYVGSKRKISDLTIIEKAKEETTMQEFDPITKENINEVLEYNGWKYDGENYNHYQSTKDGFVVDYTILLADFKFKFNYYLRSEYGNIQTDDFNEFLIFVQKRVDLKPLPKFEFDFEQYLLDNGFKSQDSLINYLYNKTKQIYIYTTHFESSDRIKYAKTKENADMLIAATKLLEGLK